MANNLVNYEAQWADQAQEVLEHERPTGGAFFSTRAGQLMLGEEAMPGNQVCCIVIDFIRLNTYYPERFDSDNPLPPVCYAIGRTEEEMAPHPTMQADLSWFQPQNVDCHSCALNEWGSAEQGRGKACQNRRQLALIPAGYYAPRRGSRDFDLHLFDDPAHYMSADVAFLRLPVTSVNTWAKYANQVAANFRRPPAGVITRIYLEPDSKYQYTVNFETVEQVPDALAQAIIERAQRQISEPVRGFQPPQAEDRNSNGRGVRSLRSVRR